MLKQFEKFFKTVDPSIVDIILSEPGVFKYSPKSDIEVLPKLFSPIFINLKLLISIPPYRQVMVNRLSEHLANKKIDYICGIESGGSYFASSVADRLNLPLLLLRKENKDHGDFQIIVGEKPKANSNICIIDDVLATGSSLNKAKKIIRSFGSKCFACVIFSYGHQKHIGKKIGISIESVSNFKQLNTEAKTRKIYTQKDSLFLEKYLQKYRDFKLTS